MIELPYALYGAQTELTKRIVETSNTDGNVAVLGGIQINTPPGFTDYFMPLSFDMHNGKGELQKQLWS